MDKKRLDPMQDTLIKEKNFNVFHFTTTKSCGNMKDFATRKDFCKRNSIDHKKIVFANQVHGTMVKRVSSADCETFIKDCDGLITDNKDIYLCIFTADCMPVFFVSRDYSVIAMVHAGWRGLAAGILENTILSFKNNFGISPQDVFAYVGPHINKCCYQISDDLKKVFNLSPEENYLSLSNEASNQLKKLGLKRVYINSNCTCHQTDTFFSYRRQPTQDRIMSLISLKSSN